MSSTVYRPLADISGYSLFTSSLEPINGVGARSGTFTGYVAYGEYPPRFVWIAAPAGQVIASAVFWAVRGRVVAVPGRDVCRARSAKVTLGGEAP